MSHVYPRTTIIVQLVYEIECYGLERVSVKAGKVSEDDIKINFLKIENIRLTSVIKLMYYCRS